MPCPNNSDLGLRALPASLRYYSGAQFAIALGFDQHIDVGRRASAVEGRNARGWVP